MFIKAVPEFNKFFAHFKPELSQEEIILRELRSLADPISKEKAKEYTEKILGDQSPNFWIQINADRNNVDILSELIQDPFILEGLIGVYRDMSEKFPKNIGFLLDKIVKIQWEPEKLELKKVLPLTTVSKALGREAEHNYKFIIYEYQKGDYWTFHYEYENALIQLGLEDKPHDNMWQIRLIRWILKIVKIEGETFDCWLKLCPHFMKLLFSLFIQDIEYLEYYADKHNLKLYKNILYKSRYKRGKKILTVAEKAHLIDCKKPFPRFKYKAWVDYFAAVNVIGKGIEKDISLNGYDETNYWLKNYNVAINVYGLVEKPEELLREFNRLNPRLAATCLQHSSIENITRNVQDEIKAQLKREMLSALDDDWVICYRSAKCYREISDDPEFVNYLLEILKGCLYKSLLPFELTEIIVSYGKKAINYLLRYYNYATYEEKSFILLALGKIGGNQAAKFIEDVFIASDGEVKYWAATILCAYFSNRENAFRQLLEAMLYKKDKPDRDSAWRVFCKISDEKILELAIIILRYSMKDSKKSELVRTETDVYMPFDGYWYRSRRDFLSVVESINIRYYDMTNILGISTQAQRQQIENLFIEEVKRNHSIKDVFIEALRIMSSKVACNEYICNLDSSDSQIQLVAIKALQDLRDPEAVMPLLILLSNSDPAIVRATIKALNSIKSEDAITDLAKLLTDNEFDNSEPISILAVDALITIGTEDAFTYVENWCRDHLDDTRKTPKYSMDNVTTVADIAISKLDAIYFILSDYAPEKHLTSNDLREICLNGDLSDYLEHEI